MGYSDAGTVFESGDQIAHVQPGDRVMAQGPHAQYVVKPAGEGADGIFVLPDALSYEAATFLPLAKGGVAWSRGTPINPGDTVVVLGQGLVGNLYAQSARERSPGQIIVIDAIELRCNIARECGAQAVLNAATTDTVAPVKELTNAQGADVVVECVGGNAGIKSLKQAQLLGLLRPAAPPG